MINRTDPLDCFISDRIFGYLMLLFRQCFQGVHEIPSRMSPAPCEGDGFGSPVQLLIDRVSVADDCTGESFQKLLRMVPFPSLLVFIQDNGGIPIPLSRPVNPHVTLTIRRTPIFRYLGRGLIGLQHMEAVHPVIKVIIKGPQIPVGTLNPPVRHHLPGDVDVIPQEFLDDPV